MRNTSKQIEKIEQTKKTLKNQGYRLVGKHSIVKVCEWCKHAIRGCGECYKNKFYGIPSWRCVQMSPWLACSNSCVHCWRPIELDMTKLMSLNGKNRLNKLDKPKEIIEKCAKEQILLLKGFGGYDKINKKRYEESHFPTHYAISLIGEPTLYPYIGQLVAELRKQGKTSFIVSNGLHPEIINKLWKNKQLPTQLYVSLNSSNEKEYNSWQNSKLKDAWKRYNKTLELINKITKSGKRTVLRMTIVNDLNMSDRHVKEFAELIKKSGVMFVEVKSYMPLGYARARMGYEKMPFIENIRDFAKKLAKETGYIVLDKHDKSKIYLLGKNKEAKRRMKISKKEI